MKEEWIEEMPEQALRTLVSRLGEVCSLCIEVGPRLYVQRITKTAQALLHIQTLDSLEDYLSQPAAAALRVCVETQQPRTALDTIDHIHYRIEMIPQRGGALVVLIEQKRQGYSAALRVLGQHTASYIGQILSEVKRIKESGTKAHIRRQCLRFQRMLRHMDLLFEPAAIEQLNLRKFDGHSFCTQLAEEVYAHTGRTIQINAPALCQITADQELLSIAILNLLSNAIAATAPTDSITLTLRDEPKQVCIIVGDEGRGLSAEQLRLAADGLMEQMSVPDYMSLVRRGVTPGLGLSVVQQIARMHGGTLMLTEREQGGSAFHLSIPRMAAVYEAPRLSQPSIVQQQSLTEIEMSCLEE